MASVWKRLQRVGKHASKFQFVASYQELMVECTKKWWVPLLFLGGWRGDITCNHNVVISAPWKLCVSVCVGMLCWFRVAIIHTHTHTCIHTQSSWCAGTFVCWEGLSCLVKLQFFFSSFSCVRFVWFESWVKRLRGREVSLQDDGFEKKTKKSPKAKKHTQLWACVWIWLFTSDLTGSTESVDDLRLCWTFKSGSDCRISDGLYITAAEIMSCWRETLSLSRCSLSLPSHCHLFQEQVWKILQNWRELRNSYLMETVKSLLAHSKTPSYPSFCWWMDQ